MIGIVSKGLIVGGREGNWSSSSGIIDTYSILTKVIQISFEMVSSGKWKMGKGLASLMDNCINQKFARVHMTCATNRYNLVRAMNNEGIQGRVIQSLLTTNRIQLDIRHYQFQICFCVGSHFMCLPALPCT
jgi:hypothetical protein